MESPTTLRSSELGALASPEPASLSYYSFSGPRVSAGGKGKQSQTPGLPPYSGLPVAPPSTDADQVSSAPVTQEESGNTKVAKAPQATRVPQLCPLEAVEEFDSTEVHTPFSLSDLKQIKANLGKFSDDLDCIDVLQGLDQSFE
ncbi:hypothetical protein AAY473_036482 [Plecturocebus cupreus]